MLDKAKLDLMQFKTTIQKISIQEKGVLNSIINLLKIVTDAVLIKETEQLYYDLTAAQYKITHMGYGDRIEKNIRYIIKGLFESPTVEITGPHNKSADIKIIKGNKTIGIEVKSFIDRKKSPQGIPELTNRKTAFEKDANARYFVFAHALSDRKKYDIKDYTEKDWIILQSRQEYKNKKRIWRPIWELDSYKDYFPLYKLIEYVRNLLN